MKTTSLILILAAIVPFATIAAKEPEDKVTPVAGDDADMKAAIAKARGLLPHFWKTFDSPKRGESGFCLKLQITDKNGSEHFWINNLERKDGKIFGAVNNEPKTVKSVKLGQRVEVPEADISDWLYIRDNKMVGNYTLRALFKTMPAQEAEAIKKKLAEP